ncbi:MAG: glutamate 5-kinase, partial [Planctomycetes bacterium]|nr:glutamate 5-kinase [Planctomycetota bacterium]
RQRFLHARNTLHALLEHSVIPIVNENDTVAVEELKLKMGDNDGLAVSVAQLVEADCLILLTDVPGLYDKSPTEEDAALISHVEELTQDIFECAGGSTSGLGLGGMSTKLNAALAASMAAIPLVVAKGTDEGVLGKILSGEEVGTFFSPRKKRTSLRNQWIAFGRKPEGKLIIDDGAVKALVSGKKSLLPIGIKNLSGEFSEADTVMIVNPEGKEIARGLSNFSSEEVRKILGRRSDELSGILGYDCCENVVHRDNLVIINETVGT